MTRLRDPWPAILLTGFGTFLGLFIFEAGARGVAVREERREGRLDRDAGRAKAPGPGATATLGQIIRRSSNPRIVYELRPRLDVIFAGARMTTSDAGYRGEDAPSPKPMDSFRIVGIGDSYMFGQGVADEETYLARLPSLMTGKSVETVNLAVPGFNTVMEAETLFQRGAALEPDTILIEIVGNDLDLPNFLWEAVDPWRLDRLFIVDFVRGRLRRVQGGDDGPDGLTERIAGMPASGKALSDNADQVPARYASMVGLPAFDESIQRLADFGRARGIPVLALTHGVWWEDALLAALSRNEIPVLVLRSALRRRARAVGAPDYGRSPLALSPTDLHPSALGHMVVAEELSIWIPETLARLRTPRS